MLANRTAGLALLLFVVFNSIAAAVPTMSVAHVGLDIEGNQQWLVEVTPESGLFRATADDFGSALAIEIGITVDDADVISAVVNEDAWLHIPGHNPFSGETSLGTIIDSSTVFVSLGSDIISSADPINVMTITTQGPAATTLRWGGQRFKVGSEEYTSVRIAQSGFIFDNIVGSITSEGFEPFFSALDCNQDTVINKDDVLCATAENISDILDSAEFPAGDFDFNGRVDFPDLLVLSANFGKAVDKYTLGDIDLNGTADFSDFLVFGRNFGKSFEDVQSVPEPSGYASSVALFVSLAVICRHRKPLAQR